MRNCADIQLCGPGAPEHQLNLHCNVLLLWHILVQGVMPIVCTRAAGTNSLRVRVLASLKDMRSRI